MKTETFPLAALPPCELLHEMQVGPRGRVHLGRLFGNLETGRVVMLREVPSADAAALHANLLEMRGLADPQLLKMLGLARCGERYYLASEYVPGVSLFELSAAVRARGSSVLPSAAVRVVQGALLAAGKARRLLAAHGRVGPKRLVEAEKVWVAEFGETLLCEVGLGSSPSSGAPSLGFVEDHAQDVLTLGVELFQLLTGTLMTGDIGLVLDSALPAPLAELLRRAILPAGRKRFATTEEFADALDGLPSPLRGTEAHVSGELQRAMSSVLVTRHSSVVQPDANLGLAGDDDATRVYQTNPQMPKIALTRREGRFEVPTFAPDEPTIRSAPPAFEDTSPSVTFGFAPPDEYSVAEPVPVVASVTKSARSKTRKARKKKKRRAEASAQPDASGSAETVQPRRSAGPLLVLVIALLAVAGWYFRWLP